MVEVFPRAAELEGDVGKVDEQHDIARARKPASQRHGFEILGELRKKHPADGLNALARLRAAGERVQGPAARELVAPGAQARCLEEKVSYAFGEPTLTADAGWMYFSAATRPESIDIGTVILD